MKCRDCGYKMVKNGTNKRVSKTRGRYVSQLYICRECGTTKTVRIK